MALRIRYTFDAENDLDAIFDYVADDNRSAAEGLLKRMEEAFKILTDNPRIGSVLQFEEIALPASCYRRYLVMPYHIFYRFTENELFVVRIIHNKRDWLHLLFGR